MRYADSVVRKLKNSNQIVIYGARIVAGEVANCLMSEPYNLKIDAFLVSSKEGNPDSLCGLSVLEVREGKEKYKDALVLVAVLEKYLDEIMDILQREGFFNVIPLTFESDLWADIRGNYYEWLCGKEGRKYLALKDCVNDTGETERVSSDETEKNTKKRDGGGDVAVYMAKCHVDRPVKENLSIYEWEIPIQVGASLTDKRICENRDDIGENISHKNREYCELTALYWIWKNDHSKFAGLCHYRRHFDLNREVLVQLENSDIDVVLTTPILNFPNVRAGYLHDHYQEDWETMLAAVRVFSPDYYETADRLQNGVFYYAYNMFIARKWILDDYCSWLFPILDYCEKKCGKKESVYQNRYIGFLAERLMSIYFLHHAREYKIVHAQKHFIDS